ncbi:hypothetical protein CEY16_06555 [Halalkalibacillus sediminis]|uniref:Uncharacterized protein n=1 Tax=Halalkalibacillus sediminis TaxID=2018042 RepID=A0A2I0QTB8_9BACI|nr:hypothetical protein [Halalkalibacillus sediminis]PKR77595.1 hypothetical protein CEY16_06555 [Halalkalibacillus sediminis]
MQNRNIQWLPVIASIGVGAATYSMMTGKGGQLQNMMPGMMGMSGQGMQGSQSSQQQPNQ